MGRERKGMVKVAEFGMTRREEIVTATLGCRQSYVDLKRPTTLDDVADAFEKGAYWADKTMIEKTCEWLRNNWREYVYQDGDGIVHFGHWESDFRKAMEE